jgi:hypothetical protein
MHHTYLFFLILDFFFFFVYRGLLTPQRPKASIYSVSWDAQINPSYRCAHRGSGSVRDSPEQVSCEAGFRWGFVLPSLGCMFLLQLGSVVSLKRPRVRCLVLNLDQLRGDGNFKRWNLVGGSYFIGVVPLEVIWDPISFLSFCFCSL